MKLKPLAPFNSPTGNAIANSKILAMIARPVSARVGLGLGTRIAMMIGRDIWDQLREDVYETH